MAFWCRGYKTNNEGWSITDEDILDLPGLRRNVDSALEAGVAGFLAPAIAAEVNKLSRADRRTMFETAGRARAGYRRGRRSGWRQSLKNPTRFAGPRLR